MWIRSNVLAPPSLIAAEFIALLFLLCWASHNHSGKASCRSPLNCWGALCLGCWLHQPNQPKLVYTQGYLSVVFADWFLEAIPVRSTCAFSPWFISSVCRNSILKAFLQNRLVWAVKSHEVWLQRSQVLCQRNCFQLISSWSCGRGESQRPIVGDNAIGLWNAQCLAQGASEIST